jgi:hypothetical protein
MTETLPSEGKSPIAAWYFDLATTRYSSRGRMFHEIIRCPIWMVRRTWRALATTSFDPIVVCYSANEVAGRQQQKASAERA